MTRERALVQVLYGSPHERLMAARFLTRAATPNDMPTIERASRKETVLWTRTALDDVISRLKNLSSDNVFKVVTPEKSESEGISDEFLKDLSNNALREATGTLIHEIQPLIGRLQKSLEDEVPDYFNSRSLYSLERLRTMLKTIEELRSAASAPSFQEFDLSELLWSLCEEVSEEQVIPIQLAGPRNFVILSDPGRIRLAVGNGLRNALEATKSIDPEAREPIVITWNNRPEEIWVSILDSGPGLSGDPLRTFAIGTTTKKDHFGMGLPVARQAVGSIGGEMSLANRTPRGARLDFRWPKYKAAVKPLQS